MSPESISEKMMYNTVRIETPTGCGTGSYFNFDIGDIMVPVIITNKHVVNNNNLELTKFSVHVKDVNGNPGENIQVGYCTTWIFHKDKDICYCYANPLFEDIYRRFGKEVYYIANSEEIIYGKKKLEELSALEELVMVGYPIGLWDSRNNFPIFRKGYTACHPAIDFNEDGIGLVDMACFPGSSGSPIYILNEGGYKDKKGNTYLGQSRVILLGYLFSGPQYDVNGEIVVRDIPTSQSLGTNTRLMVNLGYYIKANEILAFKHMIEKDLNK